jgi:hypothetical protein
MGVHLICVPMQERVEGWVTSLKARSGYVARVHDGVARGVEAQRRAVEDARVLVGFWCRPMRKLKGEPRDTPQPTPCSQGHEPRQELRDRWRELDLRANLEQKMTAQLVLVQRQAIAKQGGVRAEYLDGIVPGRRSCGEAFDQIEASFGDEAERVQTQSFLVDPAHPFGKRYPLIE